MPEQKECDRKKCQLAENVSHRERTESQLTTQLSVCGNRSPLEQKWNAEKTRTIAQLRYLHHSRQSGCATIQNAYRQQRQTDTHPPCGPLMFRRDVLSLNQGVRNSSFVRQRREGRHHDEDFEQSEIV